MKTVGAAEICIKDLSYAEREELVRKFLLVFSLINFSIIQLDYTRSYIWLNEAYENVSGLTAGTLRMAISSSLDLNEFHGSICLSASKDIVEVLMLVENYVQAYEIVKLSLLMKREIGI